QKVKDSMRVLLPVLLNKSHESHDKIRAILLYIFSTNGMIAALFLFPQCYALQLKFWGSPVFLVNLSICTGFAAPQRKHPRRDRSSEETFQLSRWTPVIKDVMEDAIENKLDSKDWPYCSQCPPTWNGSGAV
ncbi:STXB3 protein, partial [Brachypteracias leptosomus]|nr:STXB3 protein [Brachypteracias leptosomus]